MVLVVCIWKKSGGFNLTSFPSLVCAIDKFFHSNSLHGIRSHIYLEQFLFVLLWYFYFYLLVYYIYFWRAIDGTKKLCFSKPHIVIASLPNLFNWPRCSFFKGRKCIHQNSKVCPIKVEGVLHRIFLYIRNLTCGCTTVNNDRTCRM